MDPSSVGTLARVWADAAPLAKYILKRAEGPAEGPLKRKPRRVRKLTSWEYLAAGTEFYATQRVSWDQARTDTRNDLIAGRVVAVGRLSNSYDFERIPPSFWIGAEVDWDRDAVSRDGKNVIEVRVLKPEAIASVQPKPQSGPGRPSKAEVIRAAIAEHAKTDSALERPPAERYRIYRAYLSDQGYKPYKTVGFSNKTFEKFEREFRNKNK